MRKFDRDIELGGFHGTCEDAWQGTGSEKPPSSHLDLSASPVLVGSLRVISKSHICKLAALLAEFVPAACARSPGRASKPQNPARRRRQPVISNGVGLPARRSTPTAGVVPRQRAFTVSAAGGGVGPDRKSG